MADTPSEAEEVAEGVSDDDEAGSGGDPNEDFCAVCADGGDLLCCDACPAAFHAACLGLPAPPPGDWFCAVCAAALAAGAAPEEPGEGPVLYGGTHASGPGLTGLPASAPPLGPSGEAAGSAEDVFVAASSDDEPCFDLI